MLPELLLALTPVDVLHAWDERRAEAWAAGDVAGLRSLYVTGSAAGRADAAMLRAWRERGLRVEGMEMQLLSVDVRRRTPHLLVLDVVDRLVGGALLPADLPTRHVVTLRVVEGEWRVAGVS
ncbi:hypothetical protein [Nocardioides sp. SR21]|uniref:hypothetical protein n=1 Tax=Nocardioides sp. SR21 TaxID=2919501 RepID=UPI001FAB24E4|nr:hypothetical protein [Nocardioides sp. SR21]